MAVKKHFNFSSPPRYGKKWTRADDDIMLAAYQGGLSTPQICLEAERTVTSILTRLERLNVVTKVVPDNKNYREMYFYDNKTDKVIWHCARDYVPVMDGKYLLPGFYKITFFPGVIEVASHMAFAGGCLMNFINGHAVQQARQHEKAASFHDYFINNFSGTPVHPNNLAGLQRFYNIMHFQALSVFINDNKRIDFDD